MRKVKTALAAIGAFIVVTARVPIEMRNLWRDSHTVTPHLREHAGDYAGWRILGRMSDVLFLVLASAIIYLVVIAVL